MAEGIVASVQDETLHSHYDIGICHESVEKVIEMNQLFIEYSHNNIKDWYEQAKLLKGEHIHTFQITIGAKRELKMKRTGRKIKLSALAFNHSFLVVQKDDIFRLCDAWEFVHPFTCRQKTHTLEELYDILKILLKVSKNELTEEDIEKINQYFNDDNQKNWEESIQEKKDNGEDAQTYGVLTNLDNMTNFKIVKFQIKTLKSSDQCGGSRKLKRNKRKTRKIKRKTRKIKRKTRKIKRKTSND
jgi:hypothetical protein